LGLPDLDEKQSQALIDESTKKNAPLNNSLQGMIGLGLGNTAISALLPGGGMYGGTGLLASAGNQAMMGALQPTTSNGPGTIGNTIAGAIGGATGYAIEANIDTLSRYGIDALNVGQRTGSKAAQSMTRAVTDNPIVGSSGLAERFDQQTDRALLGTAGIQSNSLDPSVLNGARDALVKTKADGFLNNPINDLTPPVPGGRTLRADMDTIIDKARKAGIKGGPNLDNPVSIINHIRSYYTNGTTSGSSRALQATGDLDPEMLHDMQPYISSLGTSENPQVRKWGGILADTLNYHLQQQETVAGAGAAVLDANQKLSNLHKILNGIPTAAKNNQTIHINPTAVARSIDSGDRAYGASQFALTPGTSPQDLLNISRAASSVRDNFPQSGTTPRLLGSALLGGAGAIAGDLLPGGDPKRAAKWAAMGIGAPLLARYAMEGAGPSKLGQWLPNYISNAATSPVSSAVSQGLTHVGAGMGGSLLNDLMDTGAFGAPAPTEDTTKKKK
jgi:hypothetical protein